MINHNTSQVNNIMTMFIIMIIASIFSGMNMWVNNINDARLQLNDIYMGIIMTGWMFLLSGLFYSLTNYIYIGLITIIISVYFIRNQIFINGYQYLSSMIPHHSMAIFMSNKIKEKNIIRNDEINNLINNIIITQQEEINIMKQNI
jgi:hypothetical protein